MAIIESGTETRGWSVLFAVCRMVFSLDLLEGYRNSGNIVFRAAGRIFFTFVVPGLECLDATAEQGVFLHPADGVAGIVSISWEFHSRICSHQIAFFLDV
jgi:hypothetical protein